jgi:hypothetical protein
MSFGNHINILTVYQATKSEVVQTNYQQQLAYYRSRGQTDADPRKLTFQDLTSLIQQWNTQGDTTILMIDANDNLFSKESLLPGFLSNTSLISLVTNPYEYPVTYMRGSKCIDFIFGSTRLIEHIKYSGHTPFFESPCNTSDHRGVFLDINQVALFGATLQSIPSQIPRKIKSTSSTLVKKFLLNLEQNKTIHEIYSQIVNHYIQSEWTIPVNTTNWRQLTPNSQQRY